jgi:glycosyltransferase involved in cell wall biosynthesis
LNLSLIIFCYNEKESLKEVIEDAIRVANLLCKSYEIIVVDDGSTDGTGAVLEAFGGIRYIRHSTNQGIGMALRSGYAAATKEYVCAIPGDGQFDISELLKIEPFPFTRFYSFYRPVTHYNFYRKLLTKGNRIFNSVFLSIHLKDVNWIKVYRQDQLEFVKPELLSSIIESEITCKLIKAGALPVEVPSIYHRRKAGVAKGGQWKTLVNAIKEIIALQKTTARFTRQLDAQAKKSPTPEIITISNKLL